MAHYKGAASEGGRAMKLQQQREREREEAELRKKKLEENLKVGAIENKFKAHYDAIETTLKSKTVGLVTHEQMKAIKEDAVKKREMELAQQSEEQRQREAEAKRRQKENQKRQIKTLSFKFEDDEEGDEDTDEKPEAVKQETEEEKLGIKREIEDEDQSSNSNSNGAFESALAKKKKMTKNPDVDTSFLRDRDREEEEKKLREQLRLEWVEKQEKLKNEDIDVVFSYWDGSGHRRSVTMKKGNSIYQFLQKVLDLVRQEFHDLRAVTADTLMYVKEDLIIPHHYTFYDFIVTKARGKSGPLFNFDVHDDVRLLADVSVEKDESHAGKVLLRSWYERNKHIFPASRWEPYDPTKNYEKYTIKDTKKN